MPTADDVLTLSAQLRVQVGQATRRRADFLEQQPGHAASAGVHVGAQPGELGGDPGALGAQVGLKGGAVLGGAGVDAAADAVVDGCHPHPLPRADAGLRLRPGEDRRDRRQASQTGPKVNPSQAQALAALR